MKELVINNLPRFHLKPPSMEVLHRSRIQMKYALYLVVMRCKLVQITNVKVPEHVRF